jgi:hypothetical protein
MKFTQETVIKAPADQVDLEDWLFTLSDSEYQATAKGHRQERSPPTVFGAWSTSSPSAPP